MKKIMLILVSLLCMVSLGYGTELSTYLSTRTAVTSLNDTDLMYIDYYVGGNYYDRKITVGILKTIFQPYNAKLNTFSSLANGSGYLKNDGSGNFSYDTPAGYTNLTSFIDQTAWRLFYSNGSGDIIELGLGANGTYLKSNGASAAPTFDTPTGAYTNLTSFVDQTPWKLFYSNGSGDVTELTLGANGTFLKSNGASSAPTFETPAGTGAVALDDVTDPDASKTFTLIDNNAAALQLDTTGKTGLLKVDTTNGAEGITMSGYLTVTGVLTATASGNLTSSQGLLSALPGTCTTPAVYFATDQKRYYFCTATNEWYAAFEKGADGSYRSTALNNSSIAPTASAYEFYVDNTIWKLNQNGTEFSIAIGPTAGQVTFVGPTQARTVTLPDANVTIPANPIGGTLGATTNIIPKASGTGTATLQASGITEDGTNVNIGSLNFATTGTIQGGIKVSSDADGMTNSEMTAVGLYGTLFIATGSGTWTLDTAVAGMSVCLKDKGTAHDLILDVQAGDDISLNGTEQANGVGVTNASGSSTGDFICVVAISNGHWETLGMSGTWASQ